MEIRSPELTIEDVISIHREWITKLFIEDGHTEAKIVGILEKRHLFVKSAQIHGFLINWGIIPSASADTDSSSPATLTDKGCIAIPSPLPVRMNYEPTDQHICGLYTKCPLPPIPTRSSPKGSSISRTEVIRKVSCRLGPRPPKAEPIFGAMPERTSHPEVYPSEEQVRERFAAGLWSIFEIDDI